VGGVKEGGKLDREGGGGGQKDEKFAKKLHQEVCLRLKKVRFGTERGRGGGPLTVKEKGGGGTNDRQIRKVDDVGFKEKMVRGEGGAPNTTFLSGGAKLSIRSLKEVGKESFIRDGEKYRAVKN